MFRRRTLGYAALATVGCSTPADQIVNLPPPPSFPPPARVVIVPAELELTNGDSARIGAAQVGSADTRFRFVVHDTTLGSVTDEGLVAATTCVRGGSTRVEAISVTNPASRASIPMTVNTRRAFAMIEEVVDSASGAPAKLGGLAGTVLIRIGLQHLFRCRRLDSVLVVVGPAHGAGPALVADRVSFGGNPPAEPDPWFRWDPAETGPAGRRWPDGIYAIGANVYLTGSLTPVALNSVPAVVAAGSAVRSPAATTQRNRVRYDRSALPGSDGFSLDSTSVLDRKTRSVMPSGGP